MHEFILPPEELSPFVKRIYEVNIPRPSTFEENRIIPVGTGTISFSVKGNPRIKTASGVQNSPKYALSGQYFPTFSFACDTPLLFYGIALKPTATHKLFDIYLADIQNDFLPLDKVIGDEADQVRHKLLEAESTKDRLELLADFMLDKVPADPEYTHLDVVINRIYEKQGILKVKDLCEYEDVSRRYLEKKFKKIIGFTPGQFIRQVRFNLTCAAIAEGSHPVTDILAKFGYHDRSHFMKKFKKYHGNDLSVIAGDSKNLFKVIFSRIMRSESENNYHP